MHRPSPSCVAATVMLLLALAPANARQQGGARPLPPHDYSLVMPPGPGRAETGLQRLIDRMIAALSDSALLPTAFPQPGIVLHTPKAGEAGVVKISCSPDGTEAAPKAPSVLGLPRSEKEAPRPNCIRLGPESFVELSTVDDADARVFLFEVFLLDATPRAALKREASYSLTRVVVHLPILADDFRRSAGGRLAEIDDVLQRGLLLAGARPVQVR